MTSLDDTLRPLRSALDWLANTPWGQQKGYRTQAALWQTFPAQGLWHLLPLCAVQAWEDLPGVQPSFICLRIDLRFPAAAWPVVVVDPYRQCTTLASATQALMPALLNHHLELDGPEAWAVNRDLWQELHTRVGGDPAILEHVAFQLESGAPVVFTPSEADGRAARAFHHLMEHTASEDDLLGPDSPWQSAVNARVLNALTVQDLTAGGLGHWREAAQARAIELLSAPAPYDISADFPPLQATSVASQWFYFLSALRSTLLDQPSAAVPEGYDLLIEHGAEQGLSGLQHFELAAHASSVQQDQVTAFHHLISAAYWALENTQTELPEALQMARTVARLQEHKDAVEALESWD